MSFNYKKVMGRKGMLDCPERKLTTAILGRKKTGTAHMRSHYICIKCIMLCSLLFNIQPSVIVGNNVTCSTPPQFSAIYCIISLAFALEDTVQLQVNSLEIEVTS